MQALCLDVFSLMAVVAKFISSTVSGLKTSRSGGREKELRQSLGVFQQRISKRLKNMGMTKISYYWSRRWTVFALKSKTEEIFAPNEIKIGLLGWPWIAKIGLPDHASTSLFKYLLRDLLGVAYYEQLKPTVTLASHRYLM